MTDLRDDIDHEFGEEVDDHDVRDERGGEKRLGRVSNEEKAARERAALVEALSAGRTDKALERVAWILNRFPAARNSDITLQFEYWKEYHPEVFEDFKRDHRAMYVLPKLTSLSRARARIQNTHKLFLANADVRRRRKTMSEDERERLMNPPAPDPLLTVYADESGKTQEHLVVGTVWLLDALETFSIPRRMGRWREAREFDEELHFTEITRRTLPFYIEALNVMLEAGTSLGFKQASVRKAGVADVNAAIDDLLVRNILDGVDQEHTSARAPLPRRISVWKDRDDEGRDALLAVRLKEALMAQSLARYGNRLQVETVESVDSRAQPLIQLADLYTSSIARTLNRGGGARTPKDEFADYLLGRVRPAAGAQDVEVRVRI